MTANSSGDDSRLAELLSRWEDLYEQGRSISPRSSARACPNWPGSSPVASSCCVASSPYWATPHTPANHPDPAVGEPNAARHPEAAPRPLRLSLPPMSPGPSGVTG